MSSLANKRILLGVTGGIAAYKSAELIRRLQDRGASVRVVMTQAAQAFITPLTLQALSGHPVHSELLDPAAEAAMGHIELARWADAILVAPTTADFMARLVSGEGNDLLTTVCLASGAPLALAPAMNQAMWRNAATQENLTKLQARKVAIFGPAAGSQACGDIGPGRMLEAADLCQLAEGLFETGALSGKTVVITAGPTREAVDPVRYISNHSSGKMGYALAQAAIDAGAKTILISGPTALAVPDRALHVPVISAEDMYRESLLHAVDCQLFIAAAAVADYRPAVLAEQKIKKGADDEMVIRLVKNPDIVAAVADLPEGQRPLTVGFAAESECLLQHARGKLQRKNLDLIVANDIVAEGIGFNSDDNAVTVIDKSGELALDKQSKSGIARQLIALLATRLATSAGD
jgi:phosphopantothenoylcysteine decarboxylase/phosphopantothenate--cysteine ligase